MVEVQNLLLYSLVPSLTPNLLNNLCEFDQGHVKDFFCNGFFVSFVLRAAEE